MNDAYSDEPSLLVLIGAPAVGKTTVGQALERSTGFRLFHLHQVVDLVLQYFPYSISPTSSFNRLVVAYRKLFFEEAAQAGLQVITTMAWAFDLPAEEAAIRSYLKPFVTRGGRAYVVELVASLPARLARNQTENRRRLKRVDWSTDEYLRQDAELHRYDSGGDLPFDVPHLRLQTDELSAEATAERIRDYFGLPNVVAL